MKKVEIMEASPAMESGVETKQEDRKMKKVEASPAMASDEETMQDDSILKKVRELELSLPRKKIGKEYVYWYQNFWAPSLFLSGVVCFRENFRARDSDILLASKPKSGTTWLQALAFAILNREIYPVTNNQEDPHPLLSYNPSQLAPLIEIAMNPTKRANLPSNPLESHMPRLFATHVPYNALPDSIKTSGCRIVYICRNILDTLISFWFFVLKMKASSEGKGGPKGDEEEISLLEDYVDSVCSGAEAFGPHWDHVLGYWQESVKRPSKVLFIKYEDIKTNEILEMKRLAEFMGCPFTINEEETGVIQQIAQLCSIKSLKDVAKSNGNGEISSGFPKFNALFRNGEVGDWKNHLTPSMVDRLEKVMEEKFHGSGLTFKTSTSTPLTDQRETQTGE